MDQEQVQKPGQMALIAFSNQSKAVAVFKKPAMPVVRKKKTNQVILTEEKYLQVNKIKLNSSVTQFRSAFKGRDTGKKL
jgi:hypothetical protein